MGRLRVMNLVVQARRRDGFGSHHRGIEAIDQHQDSVSPCERDSYLTGMGGAQRHACVSFQRSGPNALAKGGCLLTPGRFMMIGVRDAARRHACETTTSRCREIPTLQPNLRSPLLIQI